MIDYLWKTQEDSYQIESGPSAPSFEDARVDMKQNLHNEKYLDTYLGK